jgi:hypothetical protein
MAPSGGMPVMLTARRSRQTRQAPAPRAPEVARVA